MAERRPRSHGPAAPPASRAHAHEDRARRPSKYQPGYVSLAPPTPGPGEVDREQSITVTWSELREALAACHYPAIPAWDDGGQARINRATDRLMQALGR